MSFNKTIIEIIKKDIQKSIEMYSDIAKIDLIHGNSYQNSERARNYYIYKMHLKYPNLNLLSKKRKAPHQ